MTYFLICIVAMLMYLISSIGVGIFLGLREYHIVVAGQHRNVNTKSCFERGLLKDMALELIIAVFYNRIVSTVLAILFYPLKGWSRNIVYNLFFKNNFKFRNTLNRNIKFYNLKNSKFKNGFYTMSRNGSRVSKNYKSKNMIVGYRDNMMTHILFPLAFMIWLYNNDNNPYDMSGFKSSSNTLVYKRLPKFLHKYIFDNNIGKDVGSYLNVGDNLIKEPAYISFILNRLFLYEDIDMNINMYFDNQNKKIIL